MKIYPGQEYQAKTLVLSDGREISAYQESPNKLPIYWGVSTEANQLGLKKPEIFMQIPNKMKVKISLGIGEPKEISSATRQKLNLERPANNETIADMEITEEDERLITALVLQVPNCSNIQTIEQFNLFLSQHFERMQIPENPNADCLRIPSLKNLAKYYSPFGETKMLTIDENNFEDALPEAIQVQANMIKAIKWLEICYNHNITQNEIYDYLIKCFNKGSYPNLELDPPINIENGSSKLTSSRTGGITGQRHSKIEDDWWEQGAA